MTTSRTSQQSSRRWWILAVLAAAQLMVALDATIVNIALPSAQADLGFSDESRQWVITGYALAFGSLLLLGGRLGDLFGRRRAFILGLVGFGAASALGGVASSIEVLVAARVLQGIFAALLAPAAISLVTATFTDQAERRRAIGIFSGVGGSGAAAGLLLGGALTEAFSWRWSMYVNLVIAIPLVIGAIRLLAHDARTQRPRIDIAGTILVTSGLFALVFGVSNAEREGWGDILTIGMLIGSVVLLAAFVAVERRVKHPLMPLAVVLDRERGGSYMALGIASLGMYGVFLFLTYYLQEAKAFSPIETGLAFLPMMIAIMLAATIGADRLLPRFGRRPVVGIGLLVSAAGMAVLALIDAESSYWGQLAPALVLLGVGMGAIFSAGYSGGIHGVSENDAGVASALLTTSQNIGGALGIAILSTQFTSAVADYASSHDGSAAVVQQMAAIEGYNTVFWIAAGVFAVGAAVTTAIFRPGPAEIEEGTVAVAA